MGKKTSLPRDAPVGTEVSRTITINKVKRRITWKRTRPFGRNNNLSWKTISNKEV